ncbi:6118_t:CDS:1, partial [Gigaspora rosea]
MKPEIQQDIINSITNSDISQQCKAKRKCKTKKKPIFNDTTSESSSSSEFGSGSELSNNDKDFTVGVMK